MDLEIPPTFDPALQQILRSLQNDMKTFAGLVTANEQLTAENESLRAQVQELQLFYENHKNGDNSRTRGPTTVLTPDLSSGKKPAGINASKYAPANATVTTATATVTPPSQEWTQVVQRKPAPRKPKAPLSERKRLATARPFTAPEPTDSPSGYEYIYIHRKRTLTRKDIRYRFSLLGVTTARVIDINFPAHSVVGILIHKEFKPAFKAILDECKIPTLDDFDPIAGANVADPKHADLDAATRAKYAASLQQDRCIRTLDFVRDYLVPSVAKYFVEQKWIGHLIAESTVARRIPRPMKKRNQMDRPSAAADFIANFHASQAETTIKKPEAHPFAHYGGGATEQMDTTEEFASNAYGVDSDDEISEAEALSSDKPDTQ
jgi:hypothetical protein